MEDPARPRAGVAEEVFRRWPAYRAGVVYADGVVNGPSDEHSRGLLRDAQERGRVALGGGAVTDHPHLAAWRSAYRDFGAKASRFPCSAEALLRRALKDGVPPINQLVDLYNAVSTSHVVPVGGEDRDRLVGDALLRSAEGGEPFATSSQGADMIETADPGEVIWADDAGVTCRRWNWRQCTRTALTEQVRSAYFVFDALAACTDAQLDAAIAELVEGLGRQSPGCMVEIAILRAEAAA